MFPCSQEDVDAAQLVARALQREGVRVLPRCVVHSVERLPVATGGGEGAVRVTLTATLPAEEGQPQAQAQPQAVTLEADWLLVAAGRRPTVRGMGLEAAGVVFCDADGIKVDDFMRTRLALPIKPTFSML
jgi:pyruvate/2-oxoglutarate dehydrogenase complex dihydrolipoamide dehydrogenase (E3) component